MLGMADRPLNRELRELVVEASLALAQLDADRLEELALSCEALNRDLSSAPSGRVNRSVLGRQAREASQEMAVFGRVLEATRSNLDVIKRIRERRGGRMEYGRAASGQSNGYEGLAENSNGNH